MIKDHIKAIDAIALRTATTIRDFVESNWPLRKVDIPKADAAIAVTILDAFKEIQSTLEAGDRAQKIALALFPLAGTTKARDQYRERAERTVQEALDAHLQSRGESVLRGETPSAKDGPTPLTDAEHQRTINYDITVAFGDMLDFARFLEHRLLASQREYEELRNLLSAPGIYQGWIKGLVKDRDAAHDDSKRLTQSNESLQAQCDRVNAENREFRTALQKIANADDLTIPPQKCAELEYQIRLNTCISIAENALTKIDQLLK